MKSSVARGQQDQRNRGRSNKCLELDPKHPWANLYRAHCLHDDEFWLEAADAYDQVNAGAFTGPICWRYEHLLEQRAYCRFRGGELEIARSEFLQLLERWETDPSLLEHARGVEFAEVAKSSFRELLFERAAHLFRSRPAGSLFTTDVMDE